MRLKILMAIGLLFLIGCASTKPQIQVQKTHGEFDPKTRIYKNYEHDLQLVIPKQWTAEFGKDLDKYRFVKEAENVGMEVLVFGLDGKNKAFGLVAFPWSGNIESFLAEWDKKIPGPFVVLTQKEIRVGEIVMIERTNDLKGFVSADEKQKGGWTKERAFIYRQFAYRLAVANNSPITDRDAEILENLSFSLARKLPYTEKPKISPPQSSNIVIVTGTSANIRSGVGNEYAIVTTVKQGDRLILIGESGEWFNVRLENGQVGWISNKFAK